MEAITIPKGFRVTLEQFDQLAQVEQREHHTFAVT